MKPFLGNIFSRFSKPPDPRLQKIMALVALVPEGAMLLEEARLHHVKMSLENLERFEGVFTLYNKKIRINLSNDDMEAACVLAHELRHMQQFRRLGMKGSAQNELTLLSKLALKRVLEGDAYTFYDVFSEKLRLKLGRPPRENVSVDTMEFWQSRFKEWQERFDKLGIIDTDAIKNCNPYATVDIEKFMRKYDLRTLLTAGTAKDSPSYSTHADNRSFVQSMLWHVDSKVLEYAHKRQKFALSR